jgi:hypothetical protein
MGAFVVLAIAAGLIGLLIYVMGSKDRYARMTEEEFEEEAKKKSLIGAAMVGFEAAWRRKEAETVMEAKSRIERDATPSPGGPPEEPDGSDHPDPSEHQE